MSSPTVVLKFGSSVLANEANLPAAILEIYREVQQGHRVVAVVSAFGETTDDLLRRAHNMTDQPDPCSLARLLETGEASSAASLGLALAEVGLASEVLDAGQIGLRTSGDVLDAEPTALDADVLREILDRVPVVVVPGFCGRDEQNRTTLLGRGGSDLTALFLALELAARECRLLKDVDGLLRVDPSGELDHATRYATAHYDECLRVGGPLIQPKAVEFAARHDLQFTIARCGSRGGTLAGDLPSRFEPVAPGRPMRVALAGLGSVGLGVFRWLRRLAEDFEVVGILVRNLDTGRPDDVPRNLLTGSWYELFSPRPELVIEVAGGCGAAAELIAEAGRRGIPVVSANKELLARNPAWLRAENPDSLPAVHASASVGGGIPVLERSAKLVANGPVQSVRGVLNGTCNFILDRLQSGSSYADAVAEAQARGFAEADPQLDVSGLDSAHKLSLLSSVLFGSELAVEDICCEGLTDIGPEEIAAARGRGRVLRLVAEAQCPDGKISGRVSVVTLDQADGLAQVHGEQNVVILETKDGKRLHLKGKGAGRYPTTCSVLADAMSVRRLLDPRGTTGSAERCPRPVTFRGAAMA